MPPSPAQGLFLLHHPTPRQTKKSPRYAGNEKMGGEWYPLRIEYG
ncbi:hypothetical protein ARMA_0749 [Ardenticatena maritima]|uniref:Uncharacterized protein n=1 Tax=Ardenticatena maritima TaxID=872965 RepID=A0A0M8K8A9_9CHLR|nr:hypothetical protein ARMA_0749 [Ardenticatena maritima]